MINREDILRRAAALLKMTIDRGCTEAEAAVAAVKLQELAESYSIDLGQLQEQERRKNISDNLLEKRAYVPWNRVPRSFVGLMNAIADGFSCRVFISRKLKGSDIVFAGFGPDAELAEYLFSVLVRGLPREAKRIADGLRLKRRRLTVFTNAFVQGAAVAIKDRLAERREEKTAPAENCTALIRISKAVVIDGYLEKYDLHITNLKPPRMSPTRRMGLMAGLVHGKKVPLQTALGS